jgi:hypothetical protein
MVKPSVMSEALSTIYGTPGWSRSTEIDCDGFATDIAKRGTIWDTKHD